LELFFVNAQRFRHKKILENYLSLAKCLAVLYQVLNKQVPVPVPVVQVQVHVPLPVLGKQVQVQVPVLS